MPPLFAQDASEPEVVDSVAVARSMLDSRQMQEAEALIRRQLAEIEAGRGPAGRETAAYLDLLVEALWRSRGNRASEESVPLALRAVELKTELYGAEHPETARSLFNLGVVRAMSGKMEEAEETFRRALEIRKAALPPGDPETLELFNALANVRYLAGDHTGSAEIAVEALRLAEASGNLFSETALTIRGTLGRSYYLQGKLNEAKRLLEEQIAHYDSTGNPDQSAALNQLANVEMTSGDFLQAADLYGRALALEESKAGPVTPWALNIRGNYSVALVRLGRYEEARVLLEKQARLLEASGGRSEELAATFERLAHIASELGDREEELDLRLRGLDILGQSQPPDSTAIADALYNLGHAYGNLGRLDEQEAAVRRAHAIWMSISGPDHKFLPDYHLALGAVASRRGDLEAARRETEEARRILAERFGDDSPRLAAPTASLGIIDCRDGLPAKAEARFQRALEIVAENLGPDHPLAGGYELELARLNLEAGRRSRALGHAFRADSILTPHVRLTLRTLPERQALIFAREKAGVVDAIVAGLDSKDGPDLIRRVWDVVIRSRALVFDEVAGRSRLVSLESVEKIPYRRGDGPLDRYQEASTRLANLIVRRPEDVDPRIYRKLTAQTRREMEEAERQLARERRTAEAPGGKTGLADISKSLPDGAALVAYVRYALPGGCGQEAPGARYSAFVLAHRDAEPVFLDLGDAQGIDDLIADWRAGIFEAASATGSVQAAGGPGAPRAGSSEAGKILRRVIWDPLMSHLGSARRVLIVPDDRIHLINLAALPDDQGGYLIESDQVLHYLTMERELVENPGPHEQSVTALLLGSPDYDRIPGPPAGAEKPDESDREDRGSRRGSFGAGISGGLLHEPLRGSRPDCGELESLRFSPLPETRREVQEVAAILKRESGGRKPVGTSPAALILLDDEAGEAEFKQMAGGRRILHLATHGFVLDSECFAAPTWGSGGQAPPEARGNASQMRGPRPAGFVGAPDQDRTLDLGANPLLFSGLALAGANRRDEAPLDGDDGILTAQEIAALNLDGTQWAVLSACNTRGRDVLDDEGVFGLQRAFQIAGARTVVASLWPVKDEEARLWMREFYQAALEDGLDTASSVRAAGLAVLQARRDRGADADPFYWGAFIASGDWR